MCTIDNNDVRKLLKIINISWTKFVNSSVAIKSRATVSGCQKQMCVCQGASASMQSDFFTELGYD